LTIVVELVRANDQSKAGKTFQVIVIEKKVSSSKFRNVVVLVEASGRTLRLPTDYAIHKSRFYQQKVSGALLSISPYTRYTLLES
jgi:hypothetical protein